jgi:hypothetical protein
MTRDQLSVTHLMQHAHMGSSRAVNKHALAVVQRGEELIAASFSEVVARLKAPLDACMEAAGQSEAVRTLPGSSQSATQANPCMSHAWYVCHVCLCCFQ